MPLTAEVLEKASGVKLLCTNTTGFDRIDMKTATTMKITVANTPGFSTEAVAEHVFALLLSVNRHIIEASLAVRARPFQINPADQSHFKYLGFNLFGRTMGIIGLGAIGAHASKIAHGFGMHVLGFNRSNKKIPNVDSVSLDVLLERSDVISLHCPLNEQSKNLINAANIAKMKKDAIVINTARGGCMVSEDLAIALNEGRLAGAGLDDLDIWDLENPLFKSANALITPHSAWFTAQALSKIGDIMTDNVKAFIEGRPQNIVSAR